jgi:hypothetical protein
MKIVTNATYYTCDHCTKRMFTKKGMSNHEMFCKSNPRNKHKCFDFCKHLQRERMEGQTVFTCLLLNEDMYSYKAEKRKHPVLKDEESMRMPNHCSGHEYMKITPPQF